VTTPGELPRSHRQSGPASWKGPILTGLGALVAIAVAVALVSPVFRHSSSSGKAADDAQGLAGFGIAASGAASGPPSASPSPSHSPTPKASKSNPAGKTGSGSRGGGKPGSGNTGPLPGVSLTTVNGDQTYSKAGQVVQNVDIHGYVRITAKNVVIKNAIIRGGATKCNASAVISIEGGGSATIQDAEIRPANPSACLDGVWAQNVTLLRVNIHGTVDGMKADDNTVVQDSWIHDLGHFSSDPNQGGGPTHNDAVQTVGGHNIKLLHNTLNVGADSNAAYQVTQDSGSVGNLRVENNYLDGGSCTLNFAHKGGPAPMSGISVVNNKFGRHTEYDCPIIISTQTVLSSNSGNVYEDSGAAIPKPQQHD
jgi:hypothetical protein